MQQICQNSCCRKSFEITNQDLALLDKFAPVFKDKKYQIPSPALCPECRQQQRLVWRNERHLYQRKCDLCRKNIVTMYRENVTFPVYCPGCWWSDRWNGLNFSLEIDFNRSFFSQFKELQKRVPRIAAYRVNSINSDYTNHSADNKNCYMGVAFGRCEDCFYGQWVIGCRNTVDALYCEQCEQCYECVYCRNCSAVFHSLYCRNCSNCVSCYECTGCNHCLGCVQLHNQSYQIFNQPVSKNEFEKTCRELLTNPQKFNAIQEKYYQLKQNVPHRSSFQVQCTDCSGTDIYNCKNTHYAFNCRNTEDSKYIYDGSDLRDCLDTYEHGFGNLSELMYHCHAGRNCTQCAFCSNAFDSQNMLCCDSCYNCRHVFGCNGLRNNSYCILNKQYTKEEYEDLVPKIIEKMKTDGQWGEFLPVELSPFAYNESVAQEFYPLSKEDAKARDLQWIEPKDETLKVEKIIPAGLLPSSIKEIPDDIINWAIECAVSKRPFKIIKQELDFYRMMDLPIPRLHPDERRKRRLELRNVRKLWKRNCNKCRQEIETTYSPERPEMVYCEKCYLDAVY